LPELRHVFQLDSEELIRSRRRPVPPVRRSGNPEHMSLRRLLGLLLDQSPVAAPFEFLDGVPQFENLFMCPIIARIGIEHRRHILKRRHVFVTVNVPRADIILCRQDLFPQRCRFCAGPHGTAIKRQGLEIITLTEEEIAGQFLS